MTSERKYVDLLFRTSTKYASWDPEVVVEVGDWGRMTSGSRGLAFWRKGQGTFLKEGNIYKDGKATRYGIPPPTDSGGSDASGEHWYISSNAEEIDISAAVGSQTPIVAKCEVNMALKFSRGRGAVLVMDRDIMSAIDPPGSLRRLLEDPGMHDRVIVSQVHRCASYARLLTSKNGGVVAIGLSAEPPTSDVASATIEAKWVRSTMSGSFKSRVNKDGERNYYPLYRLVSLSETNTASGLRKPVDPLPNVEPPWGEIADGDIESDNESS